MSWLFSRAVVEDDVGAPHERKRLWMSGCGAETRDVSDTNLSHGKRGRLPKRSDTQSTELDAHRSWWGSDPADDAESGVGLMADELASRLDIIGVD